MSDLAAALSPSWIQPLGWALIQFLWQGTLIAVLFAAVRGLAGRWLTANGRYVLVCAAFAVMTAAPVLTFLAGPRLAPGASVTPWPLSSATDWWRVMPWLVATWACGVLIFSVRLIGGWRVTSRLRSAGVRPAPVEWQEALDRLVRRLAVTRPLRLLVSSLVEVPSVVGWVRPVILMPIGALAGLPAAHVAALLAHELAHVRRHDYLVNVLQRSVEALLFYHPAVWWMSGQIRAEREMCCDDLAVAACGDALAYARALTDLESSRRASTTAALAADGFSLVARIRRLLGQGHAFSHMLPGPAAIAVMSVLWLIGIGALAAHGTPATAPGAEAVAAAAPAPQPAGQPATGATALLSTLLLGPIGPAPDPQAPQPSAPISGAPGTTTDTRRDPSDVPQTGTGIIRGTVVRADTGQPLRKVRVSLRATGVRDLPSAMTDDKGRYELAGLPPARFTLTASKGGFVTLQHGQRRANEPGRPIELADGEAVERVDLQLPAGGVISGVVFDESGEPLAGASVQAQRRIYAAGRPQLVPAPASVDITDDLGQFRLFGLQPGSYYVSAEANRSAVAVQRLISIGAGATYYPGTLLVPEAAPVPVNAGQEIEGVSIGVRPVRTAAITGVVRGLQGRAISDVRVSVGQGTSTSGASFNAAVRPDGSFSIRDLTPGVYTVTAQTFSPVDQVASEQVSLQGTDVSLALTMRKATSVHGRVTFETADAKSLLDPSSIRIRLEGDASTLLVAFGGLRVNADWTFEAIGVMGRQRLRPSLPVGWAVKSISVDGKDATDSPIAFGSGDVDSIEVQLTQRITTVSGFVSDNRGQLVTGAIVVMFADERERWGPGTRFVQTARPDQQGRFQIRGLPPARYVAVALDFLETGEETNPDTLERLRKLGTTVRLSEGEARALDLRVSQAP